MFCLPMVFTSELPSVFTSTAETVSADPKQSFYSFECFISNYFNRAYFIRILLSLLLPLAAQVLNHDS